MSAYTKRSPEFQLRIENLASHLDMMIATTGENRTKLTALLIEIRGILIANTTDSACLVKAREDEPIFVLRGQDLAAQEVLVHWIHTVKWCYEYSNGAPHGKIADAEECLAEFKNYSIHKLPD